MNLEHRKSIVGMYLWGFEYFEDVFRELEIELRIVAGVCWCCRG